MKIKSLRKYDPKQIEGILADIALRMLPDPGIDSTNKARTSCNSEVFDLVMQELRQKLRIEAADDSPASMAKIYNAISEELSSVIFANKNLSKVKERLGQNGELRPDLYTVEFTKPYEEICSKLSIRRSHVEQVLRSPDHFEHLNPEASGLSIDNAASFYFKAIPTHTDDAYSVVVITNRKGYTQQVVLAWKIYHSDVNITGATTAIHVFKKFLDVYGVEVTCGKYRGKFILYERIPIDAGTNEAELCHFDEAPGDKVLQNFIVTTNKKKDYIELQMAFGINLTKYSKDLHRHGVKIDWRVLD